MINNASYFKKIFAQLPSGEERFEGYKVFSRGDLVNAYEHEWFERKENGRSKKAKFIHDWIGDKGIQCKESTDILPPPMYCPPGVLNLWKPSEYHGRDIAETDDRGSPRSREERIYTAPGWARRSERVRGAVHVHARACDRVRVKVRLGLG